MDLSRVLGDRTYFKNENESTNDVFESLQSKSKKKLKRIKSASHLTMRKRAAQI